MDIRIFIGIISGLIAFCSYFFYIPAIIKGKTKPNRVSWWIWGLIGTLIVISYYLSGARGTIWVPVSEAVGPFLVALFSIKYGEGGWTQFDKICLLGAGIGTFLWWLTKSSEIGLACYLFIDLNAVLPTIKKSFYRPENEDKTAWGFTFIGQLLNLFAVEKLVFSLLIYPVYMIITNGIIFALQFKKKGYSAFSSIDIVSQCLVDIPRTTELGKAIAVKVDKDDIVLDLGTGSGILSLFSAKAGASKVIALELDPFVAQEAKKVIKANNYENIIDVKIADSRFYEFEPGLKFNTVIVEMLTAGMVDESQVSVINNLHARKVVTEKTKFIPSRQETFLMAGYFDFNCYGFSVPFIRHLWRFHDSKMKDFKALTDKVLLNSVEFSKTNNERFNKEIILSIEKDGVINSIHLSSVTHLAEGIELGDTDALNGPVVVPLENIPVIAGQKIKLSVSYIFGGGYETLKILAKLQ